LKLGKTENPLIHLTACHKKKKISHFKGGNLVNFNRENLEDWLRENGRSKGQLNSKIEKNYNIQFSMGFAEYSPDKPNDLDELIAVADQEMYKEKNKGKKST
jgi:GGDEF domain-containing protein